MLAQCAQSGCPQYIGYTGRMLKTMFSEHVGSSTRLGKSIPKRQWDTTTSGHSHSDMRILPIERVRTRGRFVLEARESFWKNKYQSKKSQALEVLQLIATCFGDLHSAQ